METRYQVSRILSDTFSVAWVTDMDQTRYLKITEVDETTTRQFRLNPSEAGELRKFLNNLGVLI